MDDRTRKSMRLLAPHPLNRRRAIGNFIFLVYVNILMLYFVIAVIQALVLFSPPFANWLVSYANRPLSVLVIRIEY